MSIPKIAEAGWAEHTVDALEEALRSARSMASDLAKVRQCDGAGCGRLFDVTDPRSATVDHDGIIYHFCPGCEADTKATALLSQNGGSDA